MNSQLLGKAGVSLLIHAYQIKLILILINQINLKKNLLYVWMFQNIVYFNPS